MIRKKVFRLSLAVLACAIATVAVPKKAMAFGAGCQLVWSGNLPDGNYDTCSLANGGNDCATCQYYCPLDRSVWSVNLCAD